MQTSRSSKTRYSIVGAEKSVDQNCLVRFLEDKVFATTDYHLQNYFTSDGLTRLIKLMGGPQKPGVMKALGSSFVESKLVAFL